MNSSVSVKALKDMTKKAFAAKMNLYDEKYGGLPVRGVTKSSMGFLCRLFKRTRPYV